MSVFRTALPHRSEMNEFPSNFGTKKTMCTMGCLEIVNSAKVTICPILTNTESNNLKFQNILKEEWNL